MATSSGGVVKGAVWEWQRNDGGFSPYPPQISTDVETEYRASAATCTPSGYGKLDFRKMVMRIGSCRECMIRRSPISLPTSPPIEAYWTWNERDDTFVLYTINAVIDIELAFQQKPRAVRHSRTRSGHSSSSHTVDLSVCHSNLPYTIDFSTMMQTRHRYGTQRAIRRQPLPAGQSLQSLLQDPPLHNCSSLHLSAGVSSSSGFSLTCGPATSMLGSLATRDGGATSGTVCTAATAVSGVTKPTTRKGRGKKSSSSSSSSSPSLGRKSKTETSEAAAGVPDYVTLVKSLKPADDGPCPICMCELSEQSGYDEGSVAMPTIPYAPPVDLYKLRKCGHMMHRACLLMLFKSESSKNGLTCPTCKKVHGIRTGDMPDGSMNVRTTHRSLPGHEGCGTIEIVYNFSPGVYNGHHYRANGFPRTCYLPNSPKGQKVLGLLKTAWERRLTFTIGTSVTTGAADTVVWNEIHHKTESSSNHSGHGYPDPNYLDNVLMELSLQGVGDSDSASSSSDDSL